MPWIATDFETGDKQVVDMIVPFISCGCGEVIDVDLAQDDVKEICPVCKTKFTVYWSEK